MKGTNNNLLLKNENIFLSLLQKCVFIHTIEYIMVQKKKALINMKK